MGESLIKHNFAGSIISIDISKYEFIFSLSVIKISILSFNDINQSVSSEQDYNSLVLIHNLTRSRLVKVFLLESIIRFTELGALVHNINRNIQNYRVLSVHNLYSL